MFNVPIFKSSWDNKANLRFQKNNIKEDLLVLSIYKTEKIDAKMLEVDPEIKKSEKKIWINLEF